MKHLARLTYIVFIGGCIALMGFSVLPRRQYERTANLSAPMAPGTTFSAVIPNGSISIHGSDEEVIQVTATIAARAPDLETARKLAEGTVVELTPEPRGVETRIKYPHTEKNESIRIDIDASVPAECTVAAQHQNGDINVTKYNGNLEILGQNGAISTRDTSGDADLKTYNGEISCTNISGNINLDSYNGHIRATVGSNAHSPADIAITTYNGNIELVSPPDFSATVEAHTHNGAISTRLPITVTGKTGRGELRGTIGSGLDRLYLETYNGSIDIQ
jgi:hypothetical protein